MNWNEIFEYRDGSLYWKEHRGSKAQKGHKAGCLISSGYIRMDVCGRMVYVHRIIWEIHNGPIPDGLQIDHINGIRSDNRIENLRVATGRENSQNRKINRDGKLVGCSWDARGGRWVAAIHTNGSRQHLGSFRTEEEAHAAYRKAEAKLNTTGESGKL